MELNIARYKMSRYIEPDEVIESLLYGEDKYSLMFDLIKLGAPRDEYRISLGSLGVKSFWAAMWIDKSFCEVRLELTYLEQDDVELILQSMCNEFDLGLKLICNANFMILQSEFKPRATREV